MNTKWQEIYEDNKKLDQVFIDRYGDDADYFKKNVIELLVELGEFTNETKCFKYWTVKESNYDKVLDEYADCITMILLFFNLSNLTIDDIPKHTSLTNKFDVLNLLYSDGTKLMTDYEPKLIKEIFSNILYLMDLFDLKEDDVLTSIKKKQAIVMERLHSEY